MLLKEKELERWMGADRTRPLVVRVAWVDGGSVDGLGRIFDGGIVSWREAARRRVGRARRERRREGIAHVMLWWIVRRMFDLTLL